MGNEWSDTRNLTPRRRLQDINPTPVANPITPNPKTKSPIPPTTSHEDNNRLAFAFRDLANGGRALDLLIRYEAALTRAYDRAAKQLDVLQNRKVRNEPTEAVSAPLPITSLRSSDPTRAVPIALKDFHLLEEMLRRPPPAEERQEVGQAVLPPVVRDTRFKNTGAVIHDF